MPDGLEDTLYWLREYYHIKSLKKVGFKFDPLLYSPKSLEIFSVIEIEFSKLEAKELEKKYLKNSPPRRRQQR